VDYNISSAHCFYTIGSATGRAPSLACLIAPVVTITSNILLLLLQHIPLEHCCVHNAPPVVTNSCLPPGRCKANVLLAKVCHHCTKLGLPNGHFQSGGSSRITAVTARWWPSCGELRAIRPKSCKRLSVTRWEREWHPVLVLTSTFVS